MVFAASHRGTLTHVQRVTKQGPHAVELGFAQHRIGEYLYSQHEPPAPPSITAQATWGRAQKLCLQDRADAAARAYEGLGRWKRKAGYIIGQAG